MTGPPGHPGGGSKTTHTPLPAHRSLPPVRLVVPCLLLLLAGCTAAPGPDAPSEPPSGEVAHGTVWTHLPDGPAERHVPAGATLTIHNASLAGVRLTVDGTLLVRDADLRLDRGSLVVRGEADLQRSRLHGSPGALLRVEGGTVRLTDTDLQDATGNAVRMLGGALVAHGGAWTGVGGYGVHADDADVLLRGVRALGTGDYGVRLERGGLTVEGGTFAGECGIYVRGGSARIDGATVSTTRHGVTLLAADATVTDTTFTTAREAVLLHDGTLHLRNASFSGVGTALLVASGHADLRHNRLEATDAAVENRNGTLEARDNDFLGPGPGVRNLATAPLSVPGNWWGGDPPAVAVEGAVERTPWRTSPARA